MTLREQYEEEFKPTERGVIHYSEWLEEKVKKAQGDVEIVAAFFEVQLRGLHQTLGDKRNLILGELDKPGAGDPLKYIQSEAYILLANEYATTMDSIAEIIN